MEERHESLLVSIAALENRFGIAYLDMSSGRFCVAELESKSELITQLQELRPAELLVAEDSSLLDSLSEFV